MHWELDRSRPQIKFGLTSGLIVASILLAILAIARILGADDSSLPPGISLGEQVALYVAACSFGGLLFGLLLPLSRKVLGSALLGMICVAPYFFGQWWLGFRRDGWEGVGAILATVLVGGLVGYWAGKKYPSGA